MVRGTFKFKSLLLQTRSAQRGTYTSRNCRTFDVEVNLYGPFSRRFYENYAVAVLLHF